MGRPDKRAGRHAGTVHDTIRARAEALRRMPASTETAGRAADFGEAADLAAEGRGWAQALVFRCRAGTATVRDVAAVLHMVNDGGPMLDGAALVLLQALQGGASRP